MKYALTIAIMLSLSFGLVTESFRYQSTAQLWEDDYDLLFDPARIPEIEVPVFGQVSRTLSRVMRNCSQIPVCHISLSAAQRTMGTFIRVLFMIEAP